MDTILAAMLRIHSGGLVTPEQLMWMGEKTHTPPSELIAAGEKLPRIINDDSCHTENWSAKKMLEVGLRVRSKFGEDFKIVLSDYQAEELLNMIVEKESCEKELKQLKSCTWIEEH